MSESEQTLVTRAIRGDADALTALLRDASVRLRNELDISPQWRSMIDPDDVLQVTFMEAFLQIGRFTSAGDGAFYGWLRRIADNNLRDAIKGLEAQKRPQPGRRVGIGGPADDSVVALYEMLGITTTTPSRAAAAGELKNALDTALSTLPADYAAVIRHYDLEGQPIARTAELMNRTPGAVHMLRARAHGALRDLLGSGSQFFSQGL